MRWFLTLAAWLVSAAVFVPVTFAVTMVLAGPHSSVLPSFVQPVILVLGWVAVVAGPFFIARSVWRRSAGRSARATDSQSS